MSEWLIDSLEKACIGHGVGCTRQGQKLRAQDGLTLEARVVTRPRVNDLAQVQVDFVVESPRLTGLPMLDSFAGVGASPLEAQQNAFAKFMQGSFHVLLEALTTHRCDSEQVEWE